MEDVGKRWKASCAPPPTASSSTTLDSAQSRAMENKENASCVSKPLGGMMMSVGMVAGGGEEMRKPFKKVSSPSSSSSAGSKKSLQRHKTSGGITRVKCVLIGDSNTGKSALIRSFLQGHSLLNEYVPTTQDDHIYKPNGNGDQENDQRKTNVLLHICDAGGQEEMDRLRPLCYSKAQMVIICFSVMNPTSFANVTQKWLPEVKRHCMVTEDPENPLKLVLVGTQSDLRSNVNMLLKLMEDGQAPVSETQALRLATKIGALKYVESSAVTGSNVNHIFDLAIKYGNGKIMPKQIGGFEMDSGIQGKLFPNLTERKLLFWRRWRARQSKSSKMKRLVLLPCLF